ncbi:hypothetical protein HDU76_000568 [Blyttiomyces sp. JEL0837]|nr:hypothetical protein HDU76_000568 [Blyttiomyces sp. JEL0837]
MDLAYKGEYRHENITPTTSKPLSNASSFSNPTVQSPTDYVSHKRHDHHSKTKSEMPSSTTDEPYNPRRAEREAMEYWRSYRQLKNAKFHSPVRTYQHALPVGSFTKGINNNIHNQQQVILPDGSNYYTTDRRKIVAKLSDSDELTVENWVHSDREAVVKHILSATKPLSIRSHSLNSISTRAADEESTIDDVLTSLPEVHVQPTFPKEKSPPPPQNLETPPTIISSHSHTTRTTLKYKSHLKSIPHRAEISSNPYMKKKPPKSKLHSKYVTESLTTTNYINLLGTDERYHLSPCALVKSTCGEYVDQPCCSQLHEKENMSKDLPVIKWEGGDYISSVLLVAFSGVSLRTNEDLNQGQEKGDAKIIAGIKIESFEKSLEFSQDSGIALADVDEGDGIEILRLDEMVEVDYVKQPEGIKSPHCGQETMQNVVADDVKWKPGILTRDVTVTKTTTVGPQTHEDLTPILTQNQVTIIPSTNSQCSLNTAPGPINARSKDSDEAIDLGDSLQDSMLSENMQETVSDDTSLSSTSNTSHLINTSDNTALVNSSVRQCQSKPNESIIINSWRPGLIKFETMALINPKCYGYGLFNSLPWKSCNQSLSMSAGASRSPTKDSSGDHRSSEIGVNNTTLEVSDERIEGPNEVNLDVE